MNEVELTIPRIIHQTYKSWRQIPQDWQISPVSWKKYHPHWRYTFWDDDALLHIVKTHFPHYLQMYQTFKYNIQRVDAARYMLLYLFGGLYSDLDYQAFRCIDEFFVKNKSGYNNAQQQQQFIYLVVSSNDNDYSNSLIASAPHCPFWLDCLKEIEHRIYERPFALWKLEKHAFILYSTGPSMIRYMAQQPQYANQVIALPSRLFQPHECNVCAQRPCRTTDSWLGILPGQSWNSWYWKLIHCVRCRIQFFLVLFFVILFVIAFITTIVFKNKRRKKSNSKIIHF